MAKIKRLDFLFLLTGLMLFALCFFTGKDTFDINVHDTYFVIAYFHIGVLFLLIYSLFALIYFFSRKYQMYFLGILHLLFGTPVFIYIIFISGFFTGGSVRRYYTNTIPEKLFDSNLPDSLYFTLTLFFIGQTAFLTNIIISIYRVSKSKVQN